MATENDLVLIYFEDKPLLFARIEGILADAKPNWYHVKLLLLQFPVRLVTWILRDVYINGEEFTMNGKRMRLEKVVVPEEPPREDENHTQHQKVNHTLSKEKGGSKVISLADLKKR